MKKRKILSSLNKIADYLDSSSFLKEADSITQIMIKLANDSSYYDQIFRDINSGDDFVTNQIKERDLNTHKIVFSYIDKSDEKQNQKTFLTKIKLTDILKSAIIEYVISNENLRSGDSFDINIKAINPRSSELMWEVEYSVDLLEDDDFRISANPEISKDNYDMEDITEKTGSDFIKDIVERSLQQKQTTKIEDPTLQPIRENLREFPGDQLEKAYNIALDEIRYMYELYNLPMNDPNIENMAKEVARIFNESNDKSAENLNDIIDYILMKMMPETPDE